MRFGYMGIIPDVFMSKYTQEVQVFCGRKTVFLYQHYGCVTASIKLSKLIVDCLPNCSCNHWNSKRLISPEREGFRGSHFVRFILGIYIFTGNIN